jgi:hypothetical protein
MSTMSEPGDMGPIQRLPDERIAHPAPDEHHRVAAQQSQQKLGCRRVAMQKLGKILPRDGARIELPR